MSSTDRPISPHLQIYRPQLTSVLSLLHRASGIIIALGALLITGWIWSAASGADDYRAMHGFLNSLFGKLLLFLWTLCTFYHLCNGIRHLVWDTGRGFELSEAYLSGKIVVGAAVILTVLVWLV